MPDNNIFYIILFFIFIVLVFLLYYKEKIGKSSLIAAVSLSVFIMVLSAILSPAIWEVFVGVFDQNRQNTEEITTQPTTSSNETGSTTEEAYPPTDETEPTKIVTLYRYRTIEMVEKYTEWSDWSEWTSEVQYESDLKEVESQTVYGYYYYQCPNCNNRMHGWDIIDFAWAGGCGVEKISYGDYRQIWSPLSYVDANLQDFHGTGKLVTYSIDGQRWFKWEDPNGAPNIITGYRYRTRTSNLEPNYSKWSEWSEHPIEYDENIEVETTTIIQ